MRFSFLPILWLISKFNKKMKLIPQQIINLDNLIKDLPIGETNQGNSIEAKVIDLGGGGEGIIGQLMGKYVTAIDIRQDELKNAPDGPIKIVADARNLPFEDSCFDYATAFYFLMYLKESDFPLIFKEAYRVLIKGGSFIIWDTVIPKLESYEQTLFIVPIKINMPRGNVYTAYGKTLKESEERMADNTEFLISIAEEIGFTLQKKELKQQAFKLVFIK